MNQQQILEELVSLLETNGIQVRDEPLSGQRGGLCTVRGRPIVFLGSDTPVQDNADACAEAVNQAMNIEDLYIKPQVRQYIEAHRNTSD
ncbi:MAG: hypothetical protein HQ515_09545 [Phycisphaeraceae bacterium]|nr:hypothetical protein [Phycisphaeraceae bacterium]